MIHSALRGWTDKSQILSSRLLNNSSCHDGTSMTVLFFDYIDRDNKTQKCDVDNFDLSKRYLLLLFPLQALIWNSAVLLILWLAVELLFPIPE